MSRSLAASPVLLLSIAFLSIPPPFARAGAVIELTALTAENVPGGVGYMPGTTIDFEVAIRRTDAGGGAISLRLVTLDFSASSPELTFLGSFAWSWPDWSPLYYASFPRYPKPNATYLLVSEVPGFMLVIPATGVRPLYLGTGSVVLPFEPGEYLVDALNAGGATENDSARIDFDFVNPTTWLANGLGDDLITGDPLVLTVVPEPATVVLLALGGLIVASRRRRAYTRSAESNPVVRAMHDTGRPERGLGASPRL